MNDYKIPIIEPTIDCTKVQTLDFSILSFLLLIHNNRQFYTFLYVLYFYCQVPPINQKRTISFINHFIVHTVTFLNKFTLSCEERLLEFEYKLQRIEASLEILESWVCNH